MDGYSQKLPLTAVSITDTEEIKSCPHPNIHMTTRPISHSESHVHEAKMEETSGGWMLGDLLTTPKLYSSCC